MCETLNEIHDAQLATVIARLRKHRARTAPLVPSY